MDCEVFRELSLDVLYGEADPATVERVRQHAEVCADCRAELEALRELRLSLQAWKVPPQRRSVRRLAPPRYFWASAAAAALLLGLGGAIGLSGVGIQYSRGGVDVRVGRAVQPVAVPSSAFSPAPVMPVAAAQPVAAPRQDVALTAEQNAQLVARVAEMIRQSEARQQTIFRTGLTQLEERSGRQRRYDLARIGAGLSYLDGRSGQQMARTTELMGYVLQASGRREP